MAISRVRSPSPYKTEWLKLGYRLNPLVSWAKSHWGAVLNNPLIAPIEHILTSAPNVSWTEHAVIRHLVEQGYLSEDYGRESLGLFQTHFLVMNALYQLRKIFCDTQAGSLSISALSILFIPWLGSSEAWDKQKRELTEGNPQLAEYYLSWETFTSASTESVDELLDSFWRRYGAQDDRHDALKLMELQEPVTMLQIKKRYREKAMILHPDRGGSDAELAELNDALDALKRYYT